MQRHEHAPWKMDRRRDIQVPKGKTIVHQTTEIMPHVVIHFSFGESWFFYMKCMLT